MLGNSRSPYAVNFGNGGYDPLENIPELIKSLATSAPPSSPTPTSNPLDAIGNFINTLGPATPSAPPSTGALTQSIAESNTPSIQDSKKDAMNKVLELEKQGPIKQDLNKPTNDAVPTDGGFDYKKNAQDLMARLSTQATAQKPTDLGDVLGSFGQLLGGGSKTASGGKDIGAGLLDAIKNIGQYAASGQGRLILGAALRRPEILGSGLDQLSKEAQYQDAADKKNRDNSKVLLTAGHELGKALNQTGEQTFAPRAYTDGPITRLGSYDKRTGELIKKPTDVQIPHDAQIKELMHGNSSNYEFFNEATQRFQKIEGDSNAPGSFTLSKSPEGEDQVLNTKSGNLSGGGKRGGQNYTAKENADLTAIGHEIQSTPDYINANKALNAAQNIRGLLTNAASEVAVKTALKAMEGDTTRSAALLMAFGGRQDLVSKWEQEMETRLSSKWSKANQAAINDLTNVYVKGALKNQKNLIAGANSRFLNLHPNADANAVGNYLDTYNSKLPKTATPTPPEGWNDKNDPAGARHKLGKNK